MQSKTPPQDVGVGFQQPRFFKRENRSQGPGDAKTDPRVVLLLPGHKTEVSAYSSLCREHLFNIIPPLGICVFLQSKNAQLVGFWVSIGLAFSSFDTEPTIFQIRAKDATVVLWNLPDPPPPRSEIFADAPVEPLIMENVSTAGRQGDLTSLDWNSDGTLLAIGSYDSILRVYTNTGSIYFTHPQHQVGSCTFGFYAGQLTLVCVEKGPIFAARFSKNGAWLLTASLDGTTCLWDVKDKRLHKQYRCHKGDSVIILFHNVIRDTNLPPDCCLDVVWINENTFASAGADTRILVLRVDEDEPIKTLK